MAQVSPQQVKIGRRALGRKLVMHGSSLRVLQQAVDQDVNLKFLTPKESASLKKLLDHVSQVADRLDKLGTRLDEK